MALAEHLSDSGELSKEHKPASWLERMSLRQRILLLLCIATLPGIAVAVFLATSWLQEQTQQIGVSVERLAKLAAARHDTVIENARALLAAMAQAYPHGDLNEAGCRAYLTGWHKEFPAFESLTLYNQQGATQCMTNERELPLRAADAAWFKQLQTDKAFVIGRYTIGRSGQPMVIAAYPILDGDQFKGAVALGIDLRWLDFLGKTLDLPENATITALNDQGEVLSHNATSSRKKGEETPLPPSQQAIKHMAAMTTGTLRAEDTAGSPRLYGVQRTTIGDIIIAVGNTPYLGYARYGDALLRTLASPLLVLLLAMAAAGYASEAFVTRYVRSLTRTAEEIQEGDLSARTDIPYGKYEIGKLAAAFDGMANAMEENQDELESLAEEREMLIRELNHRVKNNFQIMLSMLRTGGSAQDAKEQLKSVAGRVQTLARIHQLLYEQYDNKIPELPSYVQQLTRLLSEFYDATVGPAHVDSDVSNVDLSIGQCISFGLILNELVANSQKHAFPEGHQGGRISIRLMAEQRDGVEHAHLVVSDNGVGLPSGFDLADARSTGSRIVRGLAGHLNGEIWGERLDPGTAMHFRFPTNPHV